MAELEKISVNFILSTSRSGSTLLSSLLGAHPHIVSAVEEPFALFLYQKYVQITDWNDETIENYCSDFYFYKTEYLELQFGGRDALKQMLTKYRSVLTVTNAIKLTYLVFQPKKSKEEITTIVDKQLTYHYHINTLNESYPDCKFIVLIRDPRDTTYLNRKFFLSKHKTRSVYILAKLWNRVFGMIHRKLKHIDAHRVLYVKYEDIVLQPAEEMKRVCNFLGVDYDSSILDFHKSTSAEYEVRLQETDEEGKKQLAHTVKSLTEKISSSKIDIWKKELTAAESDLIWSVCKKTAELYQYSANGSKSIAHPNIFFGDYYRIYLLKQVWIKSLYHALPFSLKHWLKKTRRKLQGQL